MPQKSIIVSLQLRDYIDDVCGMCSGIPECCIEFWQKYYRHFPIVDKFNYGNKCAQGFGYVPCPDCLDKSEPVRLIACRREHCQVDPSLRFYPSWMPTPYPRYRRRAIERLRAKYDNA